MTPSKMLLRESIALALENSRVLVPLSSLWLAVTALVFWSIDPFLSLFKFTYDPAKATDQKFLIYEIINNVITTVILYPLWAGIYGVVASILRKESEPVKGFSAAWKRFVPVVVLGLITDVLSIAVDYGFRKSGVGEESALDIIANIAITSPIMLSFAAMVALNMGPWRATVFSLRRFEEHPWKYFAYYLAAAVASIFGIFLCGFGIIITIPVFAIAMSLLVVEPRTEDGSLISPYPRDPGAF